MKTNHKPLNVPLATEPFMRFWRGEKTVEVRQYGPRWNTATVREGRRCRLVRGYNPQLGALHGFVGKVVVAEKVHDMPLWAKEGAALQDVQRTDRYRVGVKGRKTYFDPYLPIIAFEVILPEGVKARTTEAWT